MDKDLMLGFNLVGREEGDSTQFSRVPCWEFTGYPCEKCVEQVVVLGDRPLGSNGQCMMCAETMKSSMLTVGEKRFMEAFMDGGPVQKGDLAVARVFFDGGSASKAAGWLSKHGIEVETTEKAWGRQAVLDGRFDQMSLKAVRAEKDVFVLIGKNLDPLEEEKGESDVDLRKAGDRLGYNWK